jgi:hypothetical protein
MRLSLLSLLPAITILAACSNSNTEQQTTATETMADTASKVAATAPHPAPASDNATPTLATKPTKPLLAADTATVQNVAAYLAGLPPKTSTPLAKLAAQPTWQAFAKDQDKSWVKYHATHTDPMNHYAILSL